MFKFVVLGCLIALAVGAPKSGERLDLAGSCNEELCKLPDCRCSSTSIPGGLDPKEVPQVNKKKSPLFNECICNKAHFF